MSITGTRIGHIQPPMCNRINITQTHVLSNSVIEAIFILAVALQNGPKKTNINACRTMSQTNCVFFCINNDQTFNVCCMCIVYMILFKFHYFRHASLSPCIRIGFVVLTNFARFTA